MTRGYRMGGVLSIRRPLTKDDELRTARYPWSVVNCLALKFNSNTLRKTFSHVPMHPSMLRGYTHLGHYRGKKHDLNLDR